MSTQTFKSTEVIDRSVEEVWGFLTTWEAMPLWMNGIESMNAQDDATVGPGTNLRFRSRGAERTSTVTAWEPPYRLALSSTQGGITAVYEYRCEAEDGRTRLTLDAECTADSMFWKLVHPMIGYLMKRSDGDQPQRFKRAMAEHASQVS